MSTIHRISLVSMTVLYLLAGINHFVSPAGYLKLIPAWLPYPVLMNAAAGIAEILFAILLMFKSSRMWGAYGIIILLLALLPVHIDMIKNGFCLSNGYCLPGWALWLRLVLQFVLIRWSWNNRN